MTPTMCRPTQNSNRVVIRAIDCAMPFSVLYLIVIAWCSMLRATPEGEHGAELKRAVGVMLDILYPPPAPHPSELCGRDEILAAFPLSPPTRYADLPAHPSHEEGKAAQFNVMHGGECAGGRLPLWITSCSDPTTTSCSFLQTVLSMQLDRVKAEVARLQTGAVPARDLTVCATGAAGFDCVVLVDYPATAKHLLLLKAYQTSVREAAAQLLISKWSESSHVIGPGTTGPGAVFFFCAPYAPATPEMASWTAVVKNQQSKNAHRCCNYEDMRPFTALVKCVACANVQCSRCAANPRCAQCPPT